MTQEAPSYQLLYQQEVLILLQVKTVNTTSKQMKFHFQISSVFLFHYIITTLSLYCCITPVPPTPTYVTTWLLNASSVRITWQWTSSGSAPNCFNTTTLTYHPEGGGESFLQLSDPAATEATLTNLQCNTNYTITVVATAEKYKTEGVAPFSTLQGSCTIFSYLEVCNILCDQLLQVLYGTSQHLCYLPLQYI